jgi:hypothetical protein
LDAAGFPLAPGDVEPSEVDVLGVVGALAPTVCVPEPLVFWALGD